MPVIEVKNVRKYYGDVRGVENLSFEVEEGEIYGFLGPNGAGKTTTVKILVKIIKDYTGEVKVFGKDLRKWGKDYYNKIGVSFEFPAVYSKLTALENLQFFASFYKKHLDPMNVLKMVGLDKEANQLVAGFSKGMKKKLDLARALLPDPEVFFLDEPLEGLDPASARKIKDLLLEMRENGKTIFLTTHNMYVADELCDRVGFIVDGAVRLVDNPSELKVKMGKRLVRVEYVANGGVAVKEFPLENIGQNEKFLKIIQEHEVRRINTEEPTLEEIFLKVTGRRLV
ncbi:MULTISPECIES: ABC transporter ATP-binding protein [Thermococcus]|uniref:ABC-type multidrug transport system n=2 Tax=Thermococcus sibiricus TaxID=172049 RepID=C6A210_THESM|nr:MULTISPECIES: ABC transporter ATP-binding protein [Thermococcus]KUK27902.1 MAG: ABC-type multidrug transport system [Thermococcus sp. 40_45]HII68028.1 ABC transporter ATP-binding protein [Thermococcaceae archaeon]ACS89655.1 ABC-type multidrug transport system [Thermococcus sibiricus MM 739]KUK17311.1 MAG: ABC-type multidrug transport system [Thermococcus sibiricus]MBC7094413.1 ABC transporter ATP-binding protein [Thermococcus sp.]